MTSYLILKYLHLIAAIYWLGGDFGTFLASRHVINPKLNPESRQVALRIMLACDMGPKLAMPLVLPLGLHMATITGVLPVSTGVLAGTWILCVAWFAMVFVLYLKEGQPFTRWLSQFDFYLRIALAVILLVWATSLLLGGVAAFWITAKLLSFALLILCGIAIRIKLRDFVPAFAQMMGGDTSNATQRAIRESVEGCRPWVWCIWAGLFINAALGLHLLG